MSPPQKTVSDYVTYNGNPQLLLLCSLSHLMSNHTVPLPSPTQHQCIIYPSAIYVPIISLKLLMASPALIRTQEQGCLLPTAMASEPVEAPEK